MKNLTSAGDHEKLSKVIDILVKEFAKSPQPNHRKVFAIFHSFFSFFLHFSALTLMIYLFE